MSCEYSGVADSASDWAFGCCVADSSEPCGVFDCFSAGVECVAHEGAGQACAHLLDDSRVIGECKGRYGFLDEFLGLIVNELEDDV